MFKPVGHPLGWLTGFGTPGQPAHLYMMLH